MSPSQMPRRNPLVPRCSSVGVSLTSVVDHTDVAGPSFTPDEANDLLAELRPLAEQMVEHRRRLLVAQQRRQAALERIGGNGGDFTPSELAELAEDVEQEATEVARAVRAITELGAQVKDLDSGLVDFPGARASGEPVLLCWQLGEDELAWWHTAQDGFAGRRPLDEL